ncbi:MAG TPA: molybdenum cofactor biosynthesis protein MoaE [Pirellulaceae bacterium]|jgi:molybdopterin synthase catalytic subunit|nr:molybdenum cofactor biosynthesis protein MoaE [Pirellulaceae bacterium]
MIELTHDPIDPAAVLAAVSSPRAGAVVLFLGTTRAWTDGRETTTLDYECYPEMAGRALSDLQGQARERWPLEGLSIVHRLGRVDPGEASVAIAVSSAHRDAAFEAGKWLIDTLKESVPIWKKENWADGAVEWVHPETPASLPPSAEGPRS